MPTPWENLQNQVLPYSKNNQAFHEHIGNYYGNTSPQVQTGALDQYTPLTSLFPNDSGLQQSQNDFQAGIAGLTPGSAEATAMSNPFNAAFGQSLFDLFTLSQNKPKDDYLGNLLNDSYGTFKQGGKIKRYEIGGAVDLKPIQTEQYKGLKEKIVTVEGDIFDVNATKSHDKMDDDTVTDIVGESYIGSARDKYSITKEQAEDVSLGYGIVDYKEHEPSKMPEEMLLSDVFTKKKMNPAEIFDSIRKKLPVSNRQFDPISEQTDDANREARIPYLQAVIEMIEDKKDNKDKKDTEEFSFGGISSMFSNFSNPMENALTAQSSQSLGSLSLLPTFMNSDNALTGMMDSALNQGDSTMKSSKFNPAPTFQFMDGGYTKKKVPKYIWGSILGLATTGLSAYQNHKAGQRADRQYLENKTAIQENLDSNLNSLGTASAFRAASILGQDTQYDTLDLGRVSSIGNQGFNDSIQTTRNIYSSNANAIDAQTHNLGRTFLNNTSSFGAGVAAATSYLPNSFRARNENARNESADILGINNNKTNFNIGIAQTQAEENQRKFLFEQEGSNQKIAGLGETAVNHINQTINQRNNAVTSNLANSGANVAAQNQIATNFGTIANNAAGILQTLPQNSNLAQSTTKPGVPDSALNYDYLNNQSNTNCPCNYVNGQRINCKGQPC